MSLATLHIIPYKMAEKLKVVESRFVEKIITIIQTNDG